LKFTVSAFLLLAYGSEDFLRTHRSQEQTIFTTFALCRVTIGGTSLLDALSPSAKLQANG
jgi:hypothetical protein